MNKTISIILGVIFLQWILVCTFFIDLVYVDSDSWPHFSIRIDLEAEEVENLCPSNYMFLSNPSGNTVIIESGDAYLEFEMADEKAMTINDFKNVRFKGNIIKED